MADNDGSDSVNQNNDDDTQQQDDAQQDTRTFTQGDVDRIVRERLLRVKLTPPEDYEDLKAKAAKLAELEAASQTDLERAQADAASAKEEREQLIAKMRETTLRSAIIAEAAKPERRVVDPDAVIAMLDRSQLELDDDGNPKNIASAMDALLEARPYLVAASGGSRGDADQGARGGGANQLSRESLKDMTPEAIRTALKEGRLDTVAKGA